MRGGVVRVLLGLLGIGAVAGCSTSSGADGAAAFEVWVAANPFPAAEVEFVDSRDPVPGAGTTAVQLRIADLAEATVTGTVAHLCGFDPPRGTTFSPSLAGPGFLVTVDCSAGASGAALSGPERVAALAELARRPAVTRLSAIPTLVTLVYDSPAALREGLDRDAAAVDPLVDPLFGRVELRGPDGPGGPDEPDVPRAILDLPRALPATLRDAVALLLDTPALAALPGFRLVVDDPEQPRLRLTLPTGTGGPDAEALATDLDAVLATLPAPVPTLDVAVAP